MSDWNESSSFHLEDSRRFVPYSDEVCIIIFFMYFEENTGGRGGGCKDSNGRAGHRGSENIRGTEKAMGVLEIKADRPD